MWGKISLAGILISSTLGMGAQFGESYENQQRDQKSASEALALARKTDITLINIQRILTPLDEIVIDVDLKVHCEQSPVDEFCKSIISRAERFREAYDDEHISADNGNVVAAGVHWTAVPKKDPSPEASQIQPGPIKPGDIGKVMKLLGKSTPTGVIVRSSSSWWSAWPTWEIGSNVILPLDISIYARGSDAYENGAKPDLYGQLVGTTLRSDTKLEAWYEFASTDLIVRIIGSLERLSRNSTMASTLDLSGSTLVVYETNQRFLEHATITRMVIETKGGVKTVLDVRLLTPGPPRQSRSYKYTFP
jgi:hypothetical protein